MMVLKLSKILDYIEIKVGDKVVRLYVKEHGKIGIEADRDISIKRVNKEDVDGNR